MRLELATSEAAAEECNELLGRHHYLGYSRPFGRSLRYLISDNLGRRLGCLLFESATTRLPCRERWLGWDEKARARRLELVVCNSRFLILPWVSIRFLASRSLSMATGRIAADWNRLHGYEPILLESFIDPDKFSGSSYRAANWQSIGMSDGRKATANNPGKSRKEVLVYPLDRKFQTILLRGREAAKPRRTRPKPIQLEASDPFVQLWRRMVMALERVAAEHDREWRQRKRILSTILIIMFVFRLAQSTQRKGYGITLNELWENCRALNVELPQAHPVSASAICRARNKVDADVFKKLHREILKQIDDSESGQLWKGHRVFAIDGTKLNLPRALMNAGYRLPAEKAHYPQGLLSTLYRLQSKIPTDFELLAHANERAAAVTHLGRLRENDVVVYDRGYYAFAMLLEHKNRGIHPLFRIKRNANAEFAAFEAGGRTDAVLQVRPTETAVRELRGKCPGWDRFEPVAVRLVKSTANSADYLLATTLTDTKAYPARDLSELYHMRWSIEEMYKISKNEVGIEDFHSKNENGVKQEIYAHFTHMTLVRQFTNRGEQHLNADRSDGQLQASFRSGFLALQKHIEMLALKVSASLADKLTDILKTTTMAHRRIRPFRSYPRKSHRPRSKRG